MNGNIQQEEIRQLSNLELLAKQAVEGFITGLHKSPFHGFSVEFAEHRLYNTGESTRHIDWKLFARTEKLFTKRYEEETNLRCQLVIDTSSSMYYPANTPNNKLNFAIQAAAALIYLLRKQRDAVGVSLFNENIELKTECKSGFSHQKLLFNELGKRLHQYQAEKPTKTFVVDALHQIAEQIHRRSLVVLFTDMLDDSNSLESIFPALQHLRHNKHEVILFHLAHKKTEVDFTFENRPYTFVDMETGEKMKLTPSEIKENYQKAMADYRKELEHKCAQYRIDYVDTPIEDGFNQVLIRYLAKRTKMR
ncbi:MAG: DUF58 domain-containing protein [Flavobacteriales bacterium]